MALSTYDELKASVADWLNKTNLTDQVPDFIAISVARANRLLRTQDMQCRAQATFSDEYFSLPGDFRGLTDIKIREDVDDDWSRLTFKTHVEMNDLDDGSTGRPRYYTLLTGSKIRVLPVPDQTYTAEMVVFEKVELDSTHSTSWLLTDHPDVVLYGALIAASAFLDNDERIPTWGAMHTAAIKELRESDRFNRSGDRREPAEYF
jgi:hypothetical protein